MFEIRIRETYDHCDTWSFPDQVRFAEFKNAAARAETWIDVLEMQKRAGILKDYEIIISVKEDY